MGARWKRNGSKQRRRLQSLPRFQNRRQDTNTATAKIAWEINSSLLKECKESWKSCLTEEEKSQYSKMRTQVKTMNDRITDPDAMTKMKQTVQESKKLYPGGHNEPAFALSFPSLEVRGYCIFRAAPSCLRMHMMDLEKTLQHEIEYHIDNRLESPRVSLALSLAIIATSRSEPTVQDEALHSTLELFQRKPNQPYRHNLLGAVLQRRRVRSGDKCLGDGRLFHELLRVSGHATKIDSAMRDDTFLAANAYYCWIE